jgi:hypothetical protein
MAFTTPGTAVAGDVLTAAFWNSNVRDNLNEVAPFFATWTTFTPSWSSLTVGNGTNTGRYLKVGSLVSFNVIFTLGSTSSISGDVSLTLPFEAKDLFVVGASVMLRQTGAANFPGGHLQTSTTSMNIRAANTAGAYASLTAMSSTIPFTWATGHQIIVAGTYQAATP